MEITYLLNSGFMVKSDRLLLVFDDFADPARAVEVALRKGDFDYLYIFASHAHFDHFDSHILNYKNNVAKYIFSNDIKHTKRAKAFPTEKTVYLKKYDGYEDDNIKVVSFDSTDVGTSFLVEAENKKIFHAGDFNWWDWTGDTEENRKLAKNGFFKQLKKLEGLSFDAAFFPVDGRLESSEELGAREFLKATETKILIAMHRAGYPSWIPSKDFFPKEPIPIWSPAKEGERRDFN